MKPVVLFSAKWKIAAVVFFLTIGLAFLSCAPLFAQGTAGRILGTVTDQSGGAIAGATVVVTDVDRNVVRTLMTGQAGEYDAPNLLPGNYKVHAEAKGFKGFDRTGVVLEVSAELRINLVMQPGEVSQTITVNEEAPMVETTNAELGATLQSAIIADIPLNGRNFENLLQLNPGVVIYPGGSGGSQSANGQRPHDNVYMVNGIMASEPWTGQSVFNGIMAAGDAGTILPVDAIDEFKTEENPRAEFGWKPGAIVSVGIKSGTNTLHGSAYAYGRDTAFDARNYFNIVNGPNPTKQPVALEQFGGTLGGAIKKDKLFYFVNFEGQRYSIGNPAAIPTPETVAGGGVKKSLIDACMGALGTPAPLGSPNPTALTPLSASLAGLSPTTCQPTATALTTDPGGNQFQGLFPVNTSGTTLTDIPSVNGINGGLGKVDWHPNDKNQLEGMWFMSEGNNNADDSPQTEVSESWISAEHARSEAASGDWTYTASSSLVNEVRFGYAHYYQTFFGTDFNQPANNYNFNGQSYDFPTGISGPLLGGAPGIVIQGFNNGGDAIGVGWPKVIGPDGVLEFLDHVSIIHGKHAFKFGGELINNTSTNNETSNAKGALRFGNLTDFFEGITNRARLFTGDAVRNDYNYGVAGFVQDDWRATPRLTVNLGVRYELNTVVHDRDGLMGNFDPTVGIYQTNNPYHGDHNNFAPRVGFAWDVRGDGKTVVRAGGGILYENLSFDVLNGAGNLLGLRTFPTGIPLFNAGSTTPLPITGTIQATAVSATGPALAPVNGAWVSAVPVPGNTTNTPLFAAAANPACGDGFTNPGSPYLSAPGQCEVYGVNPNLRTPYVDNWNLDIQRQITNNLSIDIGYVGNHGTKLLGKLNVNQPAEGTGWNAPLTATAASNDGFATTDVGFSPAQVCAGLGTEPIFTNCNVSPTLEQAGQPFTAPCAGKIITPGGPLGSNSPGGPSNPGNSCFSYLSYVTMVNNAYESNYNGMQITVTGRNYYGLSFTAGYTYSHALGDASDQGTSGDFPIPTNSYGNIRSQLYTNTDFDIRHRFTLSANYKFPEKKGYGQLLEGWGINTIVIVTSGLPWGPEDQSDDFSGTNVIGTQAQSEGEMWDFFGNLKDMTPVHGWTDTNGGWESGGGGLPFYGGQSNAACVTADMTHFSGMQQTLALASLNSLGCYAVGNSVLLPPPYGSNGNMKPNMFRDTGFKNMDFSITKLFTLKERLKAEFRVEIFNILNHPDWSNPSGGPGGAIQDPSVQPFGFVGLTPDSYSSNPQLGSGGARAMQLGLKLTF